MFNDMIQPEMYSPNIFNQGINQYSPNPLAHQVIIGQEKGPFIINNKPIQAQVIQAKTPATITLSDK